MHGRRWVSGQRFWGRDRAGGQLELDLVAEAPDDPELVLVGEAKLRLRPGEIDRTLHELKSRAARCPALSGRSIHAALWVLEGAPARRADVIAASSWLRAVEAAR